MEITKGNIHLDLFRCSCRVVIAENIEEALKKTKSIPEDEYVGDCAGYCRNEVSGGWGLIALQPSVTIEEIVHEANHFINRVFLYIDYTVDRGNDEIQSYLLGYVCGKLNDLLKKHNSK